MEWELFFAPVVWFICGAIFGLGSIVANEQFVGPLMAGLLISLSVASLPMSADIARILQNRRKK